LPWAALGGFGLASTGQTPATAAATAPVFRIFRLVSSTMPSSSIAPGDFAVWFVPGAYTRNRRSWRRISATTCRAEAVGEGGSVNARGGDMRTALILALSVAMWSAVFVRHVHAGQAAASAQAPAARPTLDYEFFKTKVQ